MAVFVFLLFLLGLLIGSFVNVLVARRRSLRTVVTGRSRCPHCQQPLGVCDLVPLLSFCWLRGRCRFCNKAISPVYPLVELATGVVLASLAWRVEGLTIGSLLPFVLVLLLAAVLIALVITDLLEEQYPSALVYAAIGLAVLLVLVRVGVAAPDIRLALFSGLLLGGLIGLIVIGGLYLLTGRKGIGEGDIYLGVIVGLTVGSPVVWLSLGTAFVSGGLAAALLLLAGKKRRGDSVAFGPFLVLGLYLSLLFGDTLVVWFLG